MAEVVRQLYSFIINRVVGLANAVVAARYF